MFSCNISCNGLYADVQYESTDDKNKDTFDIIQKSYNSYKNSFALNIEFYQDSYKEVDLSMLDHYIYDNAYVKDYPDLIFVDIFFDTATYDEITRDVKVMFKFQDFYRKENSRQVSIESALSLIGGTLGLLTGFSILSGVEVIYFLIRFFVSLSGHKGRKKG